MTVAAIVLAAGGGSRFHGDTHKLRADLRGKPVLTWSVDAVTAAGFDDVFVVTGDDDFADLLPDSVTPIASPEWQEGQAHSVQAGLEAARHRGHDAVVIGVADQPLVGAGTWRALRAANDGPIVATTYAGKRRPPTRLDSSVWNRVPTTGDAGARALLDELGDQVIELASAGDATDVDTVESLALVRARADDIKAVTTLLGRAPMGPFDVVVRDEHGAPVVLENFPVLADGRPMPTLYWLCGERASMLVGRLESMKGVRRAEADIGLARIAVAHEQYRTQRDAVLAASGVTPEHPPTGGVGGTRQGVKCLHAHYGWWLAGGDDPVGQWVADHLHEVDQADWPAQPRQPSEDS